MLPINDKTAKLLSETETYAEGANCPTITKEYACPCGQGKIVEERAVGFCDWYTLIECPTCDKKYRVVEGCGHIWELKER